MVIIEHWGVQLWGKESGRILIRIKSKGRIRIRIRVKSRIRNTVHKHNFVQGMNVSQTTLFFSEFGRVGRVFLQPDARTAAAKEGFRWGPLLSAPPNDMYIYIDEGVLGSGMGLFLIGGHWSKILPQNSKDASQLNVCTVLCMVYSLPPGG
jgi:hypothetical protein